MGTSCFLAPEYAESGSMTDKSDVFAFGVMVLELITGRKAVDTTRTRGPITIMEWAQPLIQAGNTAELVDPRLNNVYDAHQLNKMIHAAGRCINMAQLPTMTEVLQILERKLQTPVQTAIQQRQRIITAEDQLQAQCIKANPPGGGTPGKLEVTLRQASNSPGGGIPGFSSKTQTKAPSLKLTYADML